MLYQGEMNNSRYAHHGIFFNISYPDQKIYEGDHQNGTFFGYGVKYSGGMKIYEGYFQNDSQNIYGIFYNTSTGYKIYEGGHYYKKYHGKGKLYSETEMIFIGYFRNRMKKNGTEYANGRKVYQGEYKNNLRHGKGNLFKPTGEIYYQGNFSIGKKHGEGYIYYYAENFILTTRLTFVYDKIQGNITCYYLAKTKGGSKNRKVFQGYAEGGLKKNGTLYFPNGNIQYKGSFQEELFDVGVLYDENGAVLCNGTFSQNQCMPSSRIPILSTLKDLFLGIF